MDNFLQVQTKAYLAIPIHLDDETYVVWNHQLFQVSLNLLDLVRVVLLGSLVGPDLVVARNYLVLQLVRLVGLSIFALAFLRLVF